MPTETGVPILTVPFQAPPLALISVPLSASSLMLAPATRGPPRLNGARLVVTKIVFKPGEVFDLSTLLNTADGNIFTNSGMEIADHH